MLKSPDEGGALAAELGKAPPPWTGGYLSGGLGKKDRTRYLRYEIGHGWGLLQVGDTQHHDSPHQWMCAGSLCFVGHRFSLL